MKKFLLSSALLLLFVSFSQAQQVLKINVKKLSTTKPGTQKADSSKTTKVPADSAKAKPKPVTEANKAATKIDSTPSTSSSVTYDCSTIDKVTYLSVKKNDDGSYLFTLTDDKENPVTSFTMNQFNKKLYIDKVTRALKSICNEAGNAAYTKALESLEDEDTYELILEASLKVPDIDVIAGTLRINKLINLFENTPDDMLPKNTAKKKKTSPVKDVKKIVIVPPHNENNYKVGELIIYDLQVQFQDGFIENIAVHAKLKESKNPDSRYLLKFENSYPIPFSSKKNYDQLNRTRLNEKTIYSNDSVRYIFLGDLLKFEPNYTLYTKDYFPDNQIYKAEITDTVTTINLKKEKTSDLLSVQVFSDLKGAGSNSPNGLVQINFGKKLNLLTQRVPIFRFSANLGFLNYFSPEFTLSKIEDNQKNLVLSFSGSSPGKPSQPNVYATSTDLMLYQQYQVGGKLNLILLDLPNFKSTIFINAGFRYGRTSIQDTSRTYNATTNVFKPIEANNVLQYGANSFQMIPEVQWAIYPDERYGFCFTQQFNNFRLLNEKFQQIDDSLKYNTYLKTATAESHYNFKRWVATSEIVGFIKPSSNNQLFFRYRYNWDVGNAKNNFNQIQIGITTFLTSTNTANHK